MDMNNMMDNSMINSNMMNSNMINPNMMNPNMMNPSMMNPSMMNTGTGIETGNVKGTSIEQLRQNQLNKSNISQNGQHGPNDSDMRSTHSRSDNDGTIENLISDINESFDDFSPSDEKEESEHEDDQIISYTKFLEHLKEPALLLTIYLIMSQEQVKNIIGKYVTYINPKEDGSVTFVGVIVYGLILVILFITLKKLLIK